MANDVQYLIDMLYEMIDGAKGVLMSPDKCIIVREDALDLLDELKGQLPLELKKAQDLIRARDEFVDSAKKEAEKIRRQADLDAKTIVGESEITRAARDKAHDILRRAEERSKAMVTVTNEYTDDALRRTEEALQMALEELRESRARFRAVSNEQLQAHVRLDWPARALGSEPSRVMKQAVCGVAYSTVGKTHVILLSRDGRRLGGRRRR